VQLKEIERRFLAPDAPTPAPSSVELWQTYLVIEDSSSVRIRSIDGTEFWLSIKRLPLAATTTLVRDEFEVEISSEQFSTLALAAIHKPIEKIRQRFEGSPEPIYVDVFKGHLAGLVIAEVEFDSVELSYAFAIPDWFSTEVTEDRRFLNTQLAMADKAPANDGPS
jgi:CYTH domain-containing protein